MSKPSKKLNPEELSSPAGELMFNWNGHLWGAYEVLGLSPNASSSEVDAAYQAEIIKLDKHSRSFIKMAYDLIKSRRKA